MKILVTIQQTTYTTYVVEADSFDDAEEMVLDNDSEFEVVETRHSGLDIERIEKDTR